MPRTETSRRDLLKALGVGAAALGAGGLARGGEGRAKQPNIIFILADDLGWAELGCYGNRFNETPNLDRLAAEGMRFTQAYAAAPVCSPYRAALMTGQYPARIGITDYLRPNSNNGLSTDYVSIARLLRKSGYATGMIGKWHLTGYRYHGAKVEVRPTDHGFDEELVSEIKGVGNGANFWPYVFRTQPISWLNVKSKRLPGREYLVDRMNAEAVDFIERHASKGPARARPFFLYLSHFATHTILNGKPELVAKYRKKHRPGKSSRTRCYLCQDAGLEGDADNHWAKDHNPHLAAMLESIDDGVGMIVKKLRQLGLADNTIVVFTSDNGGESKNVTSNSPLRGGKSELYEGGIRVPLIVRYPGVVPPRSVCEAPTSNVDFYPTFAAAAGAKPDRAHHLDGVSMLPILKDLKARLRRDALYWHHPLSKPHFLGGRSAGAVRQGDWKLIELFDTGEPELYNLADDPGELHNLAAARPAKAAQLKKLLADWRKATCARPVT
jgi:arylsulfatase A-like enzyme